MFTQNKVFIGKGNCLLQNNTTSKPQKIKCNWQKLKEISKLLFIIRSSKQGGGLVGSIRDPIFKVFLVKKTIFLPELNLLVENFYFLWTNNYVAHYEYWMPHFSFLFILIAVIVIVVVGATVVAVASAVVA